MIADAKGFFKAEKLDFKLVIGNAGTHGRQTLAAGQALFAHGDASHPLQLSTRGKKCKIILATQMIASIANIVVRKDLYDAGITPSKSSPPTSGRTAPSRSSRRRRSAPAPGCTAPTCSSRRPRRHDQLGRGRRAEDHVAGLETKQFDAIMAVPGWVSRGGAQRLRQGDLRHLASRACSRSDFGGTVPVLVLYTLEDTIEQNKALVQSFVNAMYQAMRWVKATPDRRGLCARRGASTSRGSTRSPSRPRLGFDKATWDYDGRIDKASFERGGKVWYRNGSDIPRSKYEDLVDMSFLDAAQAKFR